MVDFDLISINDANQDGELNISNSLMKETDKSFHCSYSSNNIQLRTFRTTASIKKRQGEY
jgi:hypothetical protein